MSVFTFLCWVLLVMFGLVMTGHADTIAAVFGVLGDALDRLVAGVGS